MLQVMRRIVFFALCSVTAAHAGDVDWMFGNSLGEDYVTVPQTSVVLPQDYYKAMDLYKVGKYQIAVRVLENLRDLYLPDGRIDFVYFALGECYRQLKLRDLAVGSYRNITTKFPASDKVAPSYFRLLQYAYNEKDTLLTDTICTFFQQRYRMSPLFFPVLYITAKSRYDQDRFDEAIHFLSQISPKSSQYLQAQFLTALCHVQKKEWEKALLVLDFVRKSASSPVIANEADILMADIYFNKGQYQTALQYYAKVPRSAKRYFYSLVKTSRTYLEMGKYDKARDIAKTFIQKNKTNDYFFEMVSILEQAYSKLKDKANAERMQGLIYQQLKTARLSFEIYDESSRVSDMVRVWQIIEFKAIQQKNDQLLASCRLNIDKLNTLGQKDRDLLFDIGAIESKKGGEGIPGLAERRYLDILKEKSALIHDTLVLANKDIDSLKLRLDARTADSAMVAKLLDKAAPALDSIKQRYGAVTHEEQLVVRECLGEIQGRRQADENLQAKFVDWAFLRYQDKKIELAKLTKEVMARGQSKPAKDTLSQESKEMTEHGAATAKKDTLSPKSKEVTERGQAKAKKDTLSQKSKEAVRQLTSTDVDKLQRSLVEDRTMLISHITSMQYVYPQSKYIAQLLFRLAELYFDQAADDFEVKLHAYEKKMAEGKDTTHLVFPEYDLRKVVETYDNLVRLYPRDPLAPAALFYKALSMQKLGEYDKANDVLLELTRDYPESEYYVEATMNVARYYFEHPKLQGGKGYKLAEEMYHKVLYFRDHPQFVSALYGLGWCYYMEDQFDEAIAVFKYLVEEVALDFDVTKIDEKKQVTNPLLRDEAIDYIAISFDEESRIDDAVKFLQLIGNVDYAAMVLKRIAELRTEVMDYPSAVRVYRRLLAEYPQSIAAPEAEENLIKVFELMNKPDSAMKEREAFFGQYAKGGQWQDLVWKRDSLLVPRTDSLAISMGLYLSDASYRNADAKKDPAGYAAAAKYYAALVEKYPHDKRAADALWNLAVILDTKLDKGAQAYDNYLVFSKMPNADAARREQAALNAIAIAQRLLPADTAAEEGKLEGPALKVIDAVNNYKTLFPAGKSFSAVLLSAASVYFNRKMYANAAEYYDLIVKKGTVNEEYYEAEFLLGQCHFGKENWDLAAQAFEKVWKGSADATRRAKAYKLLLQAVFSSAKQAFASGAFARAGEAFLTIDQKYPGSEYGDVVLFKAAESYEKVEDWAKACDAYFRLKSSYPQSKLAPSALFNAATDYEKANKFDKASEAYEQLVASYAGSDKAKDALFNLGLCYEKLNKMEKMAEANERYTQMYPAEKDVEAMLLRSAQYYYKANMFEKGTNAYRSYVRRFPQSPRVVEALFMIGKMAFENKDRDNALLSFSQAEQLNARLAAAKMERNDFYAAEAAYYLANMKREEFVAIKFVLPDAKFKADQKLKASLLSEAIKSYEAVMQYHSERLFEAAYRIGQMYEDFVDAWRNQERPKLPALKLAVLEKDIAQAASLYLQKAFVSYTKALDLAKGLDSMSAEQKTWVYKVKVSLAKDYLASGQYLTDAYLAMQNAPVPPEIKDKPLYYYQYLEKILETLEPMKSQASLYLLSAVKRLDSLGLKGENSEKCLALFHQTNFLIGNEYDKLAEKILKEPEIPAGFSAADREELLAHLQDIVYELQDKAIFAYEDALSLLKKQNMVPCEWSDKILLGLARLSPDKYGKEVFKRVVVAASKDWSVRGDSIAGWRSNDVPSAGWQQAHEVQGLVRTVAGITVPYIWHPDTGARNVYAWQHMFLPGQPRDAKFYIMVSGKYWLYINGTLTSNDTVGKRSPQLLDSVTGIQSLVKGGDNDMSLHVINVDSTFKGLSVVFSVMLDTTQHFKPSGKYSQRSAGAEPAAAAVPPAPAAKDTGQHKGAVTPAAAGKQGTVAAAQSPAVATKESGSNKVNKKGERAASRKQAPAAVKYRNSKDVMNAVLEYQKKTELVSSDIKKEQLEVQKLKMKADDLNEQIRKVREETELLKKKPDEKQKPVEKQPEEKQKPEANQKFDEKPKPK
jgi:cellulose synthase operon protein C